MNKVKSVLVDLTPELFSELQDVTGKYFTKFVSADGMLLSSDFHSLQGLLDQKLRGNHSWLNLQNSQLKSSLLHYKSEKGKDPYATSACALVPVKMRGMFSELFRGWTVIKEITPGTPIITVQNGVRTPTVAKYHMQVLYDPVMTEELAAAMPNGRVTMHFLGKAAGREVDFLFDSGASANFVSQSFANIHGLVVESTQANVRLGTGDTVQPKGECSLHIRLGDYHERIKCFVIDMLSDYQVIMGDEWLQKTKATFDFGTAKCAIHKYRKKFTLRSASRSQKYLRPPPVRKNVKSLSLMQMKRALRKKNHVLMIQVSELDFDLSKPADVRLKALLEEFEDVFPPELPSGLPPVRGVGHSIRVELGSTPPSRPMYRLSPTELDEVKAKVSDLLEKGFIEPSSSPYGAPILFVAKKDGSLRMVQDYRYLNKITIKDSYPLPRIDDLLDRISGAKYFSSLDLTSGYYQIRIPEEDVPKTAFKTPMGLFQFKVLCFGLTNAPATFQAAMDKMLGDFINDFVVVYLDDIMIYSKTLEDHEKHLRAVLERLREHKFYANLKKCDFMKSEVAFLGHIISADGIKVDPKKVQAVSEWDVPRDVRGVRSFLGLANYFRRFIQGFSKMVAPLTNLTKKDNSFVWTSECQDAFEKVKYSLTQAPVLVSPTRDKPYEVVSDASGIGLGAVLLQDGRPVAFESRKLSGAEQNYTVTEQEMLGVVHALQRWRCYLEGADFTVVTDHCPNTFFNTQV